MRYFTEFKSENYEIAFVNESYRVKFTRQNQIPFPIKIALGGEMETTLNLANTLFQIDMACNCIIETFKR